MLFTSETGACLKPDESGYSFRRLLIPILTGCLTEAQPSLQSTKREIYFDLLILWWRGLSDWLQYGSQLQQEFGNLILNDAPDRIVIDTEITVYQPIARSNNHTPRNIGMCRPDIIRNMGRCLADQFKIA